MLQTSNCEFPSLNSGQTAPILTLAFHGIYKSFQENAGTVPLNKVIITSSQILSYSPFMIVFSSYLIL
jgi:hypothetical protein